MDRYVLARAGEEARIVTGHQAQRLIAEAGTCARPLPQMGEGKRARLLARFDLYPLVVLDPPEIDPAAERLEDGPLTLHPSGKRYETRQVAVPLPAGELADREAQAQAAFEAAVLREAGLALIRWQAGVGTEQDFRDAIAAAEGHHGRTL